MPPRKTAAARTETGQQPPAKASAARSRTRTKPPVEPEVIEPTAVLTFAEYMDSRPFQVRNDEDDKLQGRSFQIRRGVVERTRATADGIQHRAYGTDLEGKVPGSISGLVEEALESICTYYENLLNNGEEFRRVRRLPPGPSREGAQRGADKRAEIRAAKAKADSTAKSRWQLEAPRPVSQGASCLPGKSCVRLPGRPCTPKTPHPPLPRATAGLPP